MKKIFLSITILAVLLVSCTKEKQDVPAYAKSITNFRIKTNTDTGDTLYSKVVSVKE